MTETTTTAPKFPHISSPGHVLARPLPQALTEKLPPAQRKEHERLVGRVEEAGREIARLRREIDQAPARDRSAATEAALAGEELPERSEPKLRAQMEEAFRVKAALDSALRTSANRLLAAAAVCADEVAGGLERQLADGAADMRARLADLRDGIRELAELYSAAGWTRALADADEQATTMRPYQAGRSAVFSATLSEIRTAEQALEHDLGAAEERRRQARGQRDHQRQVEEQWAGERKRRAREDAGA
jgi:hypothetical protein